MCVRLVVSVVFLLLALSQCAHAQQPNSTWYMCGVLQGSTYISVVQASLIVSTVTSTQPDYNGVNNTAYTAIGLNYGSRNYTVLTSSPASAPTVSVMSALAAPGSTGGNDNLFWPGSNPPLDGDGLTFNFTSAVPIAGQTSAGTQMNFWWASGSNSLDEETAGGTHETSPLQSTISFSQSPISCTVPSYAQFSFCLQIIGPGYTSSDYGLINTSGTAVPVAASSSNGLSASQQGWMVTSVNATRVFTNTSTSSVTTSALTSVAASNSVAGNDNYVYPNAALAFDSLGLGVAASPAAPIAGGYGASSTIAIKGSSTSSGSLYYEQAVSGQSQPTPTSSYLTLAPYLSGQVLPQCKAVSPVYTFCWQVTGLNYSSYISGTITIDPLAVIVTGNTGNQVGYTVVAVTGTRTFTDKTTGQVTVSTINGLMPTGSTGGNDNILLLGSQPLLDGDGITVNFTSIPPVYGQYNQPNMTTTLNLWWTSGNYDEENKGGTHESSVTASSFTITPTTTPNVIPACPSQFSGAALTAQGQPVLVAAAVVIAALLSLLL